MRFPVLLILAILTAHRVFAGPGETGFAFMKIGVDARAAGMGEAMTAVSTDATAWFWNPAGMAMSDQAGVVLTHNQWIEEVRHNFLGLKINTRGHSFGIHYIATGVSDIEQREIPSDEPTALFSSHDVNLGLSYARRLNERWAAGVTVNYLYERIQHSVDAVGVDVGVWYHVNYVYDNPDMNDRWRVGLAVSNIGYSGKFIDQTVRLPGIIRLGSSYDVIRQHDARHRVTMAVDLVKPIKEDINLHAGAEYAFRERMFFRAGYVAGHASRSFSGGVGMKVWERWRLDYAVVPFKYELGLSHRLTAAFEF